MFFFTCTFISGIFFKEFMDKNGQTKDKQGKIMVKKGPGPQKSQPRPKSGKNGQKWPTIAKLGKKHHKYQIMSKWQKD